MQALLTEDGDVRSQSATALMAPHQADNQTACERGDTAADVFTCGAWTVQPSTSAQYVILKSPMQTATHPSSWGHANYALALRTNYPSLFPY